MKGWHVCARCYEFGWRACVTHDVNGKVCWSTGRIQTLLKSLLQGAHLLRYPASRYLVSKSTWTSFTDPAVTTLSGRHTGNIDDVACSIDHWVSMQPRLTNIHPDKGFQNEAQSKKDPEAYHQWKTRRERARDAHARLLQHPRLPLTTAELLQRLDATVPEPVQRLRAHTAGFRKNPGAYSAESHAKQTGLHIQYPPQAAMSQAGRSAHRQARSRRGSDARSQISSASRNGAVPLGFGGRVQHDVSFVYRRLVLLLMFGFSLKRCTCRAAIQLPQWSTQKGKSGVKHRTHLSIQQYTCRLAPRRGQEALLHLPSRMVSAILDESLTQIPHMAQNTLQATRAVEA